MIDSSAPRRTRLRRPERVDGVQRMGRLGPTAIAILVLFLAACGGGSGAPAHGPTGGSHHRQPDGPCRDIISACHERDPGSGPIHDCHQRAHVEWSPEQCTEHRDHCLEVCRSAD